MSPVEIVLILVLVGYAIFRQTQRHEVVREHRFKLAIIYGAVGLLTGALQFPHRAAELAVIGASLLLSAAVGLARGRLTPVWVEDGRVHAQGNAMTVGLFLGMVAVKFALGTWAWFQGYTDTGNFGIILLMIGIMVAFQAEIIWRRGRALGAGAEEQGRHEVHA